MEFILAVVYEYFDYICIVVAFILARYSSREYRAIAYLLFAEFFLHQLAYIIGIQITDLLNPKAIYLAYIIIEALIIGAMIFIQAHLIIINLIFINLGYNVLTILQYYIPTYNFFELFKLFVGVLMLLELIYLAGITGYVKNYRRKWGFINTNHIDKLFCVYRRRDNWLYLQGSA